MKSRESGRSAAWLLALSSILFLASLLSKETAITLPAVLVAYDYFKEGKIKAVVRNLKRYLPFMAAIVVYFILRFYALGEMAPRDRMHPYLDTLQHLINVFPLFVEYLLGLLVPTGLSTFHVFNPVYTLFEARSLISVLVTLLLVITVYGLRKRLGAIHVIAICFVVLPLLPVLYVPLFGRNVFADRYLYLPSAGYAILLASVFKGLTGRSDGIKRGALRLAVGIFLVVLGLHALKTVKRTFDWRDDHTLWASAIEQDHENYFAYDQLGLAHIHSDSLDAAAASLEESIRINTGRKHTDPLILGFSRINLARTYHKMGLLDKAVSVYEEVMDMDPARYETHYNLAVVFQEKGDLDRALASYGNALRFAKEAADLRDIYNNVGNIYNRLGLYNEAIGYYEKSISIDPGYTVAANNLKLTRRLLMGRGAR
jgi:tetratricopeptide (TPR) repeat protein